MTASGLVDSLPQGATYCLDVPESNPAAVGLAERNALSVVFETARIYNGPAPVAPLGRVFGVTFFERG